MKCKICGIERLKKNLTAKLCFKCFNKVEDFCKHTGLDWNEGVKTIRSQEHETKY